MGGNCSDCKGMLTSEQEKKYQQQMIINGKVQMKVIKKNRIFNPLLIKQEQNVTFPVIDPLLQSRVYTGSSDGTILLKVTKPDIKKTESFVQNGPLNKQQQLKIECDIDIRKRYKNSDPRLSHYDDEFQNPQNTCHKPSQDITTGKHLSHELQQKLIKTGKQQSLQLLPSLTLQSTHKNDKKQKDKDLLLINLQHIDILESRQSMKE